MFSARIVIFASILYAAAVEIHIDEDGYHRSVAQYSNGEAKEYCNRNGMRLANLPNYAACTAASKYRSSWTGLLHAGSKIYMRDDGSAFDIAQAWGAGEPNQHGDQEHCVEVYGHGKLNDERCSSLRYALCEAVPLTVEPEEVSSNTQAPTDMKLFASIGLAACLFMIRWWWLHCMPYFACIWIVTFAVTCCYKGAFAAAASVFVFFVLYLYDKFARDGHNAAPQIQQ